MIDQNLFKTPKRRGCLMNFCQEMDRIRVITNRVERIAEIRNQVSYAT